MSAIDPAQLIAAGQILAKDGGWTEARALFKAALSVDPVNVEALVWLAATSDNSDETIKLLLQASELAPNSQRIRDGLTWAMDRQRANPRQRESRVLDVGPIGRPAAPQPEPQSQPMPPLQSTERLVPRQGPDELQLPWTNQGRTDPQSPLWPRAPQPEPAQPAWQRQTPPVDDARARQRSELLIDQAVSDMDVGRIGAAISALEEALQLSPNHVEALEQLGVAYYRAERIGEAERIYHRILALQPAHAEAHANLGLLYSESGRPEMAEQEYRRALGLDPGLEEVRLALADLMNSLGRVDDAVAEWRVAAERNPAILEFRVKIGDAYAAAARYDEAAAAYSRAIERNNDDPSLRLRLGRTLRASGRSGAALEQFREACWSPVASAECYLELAELLMEVGRDSEAWEAIDRAQALDPDNPDVRSMASRLRPRSRSAPRFERSTNVIGPSGGLFGFLRRG